MPNRDFVTLATRIASDAPGCPQPVLVQHIRNAAIDVCERSLAWRGHLDVAQLSAGVGEYAYTAPEGAEVHAVIASSVGVPGDKAFTALKPTSNEAFFAAYPGWPNITSGGVPRYITHLSADAYGVAPLPDKEYAIDLWVCLKPLHTSVGMDKATLDDIEKVVSHGALQSLLVQSGKPWANENKAAYHGRQYSFLLNERRARYNLGTPRAMLVVKTTGYL